MAADNKFLIEFITQRSNMGKRDRRVVRPLTQVPGRQEQRLSDSYGTGFLYKIYISVCMHVLPSVQEKCTGYSGNIIDMMR